jgi:hypothetical protein
VQPLSGELAQVGRLMSRYASVPMAFPDACLVRLAELHPKARVLTLDREFGVYRRDGRKVLQLVAPFST